MQAPLVASTELLIPVDVGSFACEGMRQLLDAIARQRQEVPHPVLMKSIETFWTKVMPRFQ
jgi:cellulose biosynthesis protein BcsQ